MDRRICEVEGCNNIHLAQGLCRKHYDYVNRPEAIKKVRTIRESYLEKSKELFIINGYTKTSLRMIAKSVGYSVGNIYAYWKTKEELFNEITSCVKGMDLRCACDYPTEYAMVVEKMLSEKGILIKKLSELSPELLVAML